MSPEQVTVLVRIPGCGWPSGQRETLDWAGLLIGVCTGPGGQLGRAVATSEALRLAGQV
jgi:hypothetical protein